MSIFANAVSIHPYFKIQEGQMEACRSFLVQFCEKVRMRSYASTIISPSKAMNCSAARPITTRMACRPTSKTVAS